MGHPAPGLEGPHKPFVVGSKFEYIKEQALEYHSIFLIATLISN